MWNPLPASFSNGFGEKSAKIPFEAAFVLTIHLKVAVLSAAVRASE